MIKEEIFRKLHEIRTLGRVFTCQQSNCVECCFNITIKGVVTMCLLNIIDDFDIEKRRENEY